MLEQRRLDTCLYDAIVKLMPAGKLPEDKDMLVAAGFAAFNSIYGEIGGEGDVSRGSTVGVYAPCLISNFDPFC